MQNYLNSKFNTNIRRNYSASSLLTGFCIASSLFTLSTLSSCSQEDISLNGDVQEVTFCAQLPGNITRSFGEGTQVNELKAFVYDKDFKYVTQADGTMEGANGVVTIPLAKGIDYKVVFWAGTSGKTTYAEEAAADGAATPYEITWNSGEMKVNYAAMAANDDANDAFSYTLDFKGGNAAPPTISLTRPFAQVNFGTDDLTKAAVTSAYKGQVYTQVKFKAANSMNLVKRTVAAPSETYFTNGIALIPAQTESFPITGYNYTNMIYMLAPEGSTALADMEFSVYTSTNEGDKLHSFNVSAAPVQANFRTNVYGSLLTSTTDFNVQIAPGFTQDFSVPVEVATSSALEAALAGTSNAAIVLTADLDKSDAFVASQGTESAPREITVNLNGHKAPSFTAEAYTTIIISDNAQTTRSAARTRAGETTYNTLTANANGTIIVIGGTHGELVCDPAGTIKVSGGRFTSDPTLYVAEDQRNMIAYDGTFYQFDSLVWNGTLKRKITPVTNAEGKEVYTIEFPSQLAWYADNATATKSATHIINIEADLDFGGHTLTPITQGVRGFSKGFCGTFDGKGHTIKNFKMDGYICGIIALAENAVIKNLSIENADISGSDSAGGILGFSNGNVTIENCHNKGCKVTCGNNGGSGGMAGRAYNASNVFLNCSNSGEICGAGGCKTAGIVGIASVGSTRVESCSNSGTVGLKSTGFLGGMIGYSGSNVEIVNCTNSGTIGDLTGQQVGGILGGHSNGTYKNITITNCVNNGAVSGQVCGGIVGRLQNNQYILTATDCTNTGSISGTNYAGGIVGSFGKGQLTNCSNTGAVSANSVAGGVVGHFYTATDGVFNGCKGGDNTLTATTKGRIFGSIETSSLAISIPATGNATTEEIGHIGSASTNGTGITISAGTFVGFPVTSNALITISEGAAWDKFPGEIGSWKKTTTGWTKQ